MTIHTRATSAPFSSWSNLRKSLYTEGSATRRGAFIAFRRIRSGHKSNRLSICQWLWPQKIYRKPWNLSFRLT